MRRVVWMAGALVALLVAGRVWEAAMWNRDARRDPVPGRRVGSRQIYCTGSGSPTVILESGLGDALEQWRLVQPGVSEFARVFHGRYGAEVVGAVLVDAVQEDQYKVLPGWEGIAAPMRARYRRQARWAWLEVEFGILRLRLWMEGIGAPYRLLQAKFFRTRWSELEQMEVSAEQARAAGGLGSKPLLVLTGERGALRGWKEVQERLTALSTDRKWVVLADSGHDVPADRPDAVIAAIREVAAKAAR